MTTREAYDEMPSLHASRNIEANLAEIAHARPEAGGNTAHLLRTGYDEAQTA